MEKMESGIESPKHDIRVFTGALEALVDAGKQEEAVGMLGLLNDPQIKSRIIELSGDEDFGKRVYLDLEQTLSS